MKLQKAAQGEAKTEELAQLHFKLGRLYSQHVLALKRSGWKFDLIGLHGQTIFHAGRDATWQIGSGAQIAAATQCQVVCNFREMDIALHGQGAPLAPFFHEALLESVALPQQKSAAFHNLGGISNLTWVGFYKNKNKLIGFDTGPANMLMDLYLQKQTKGRIEFDKNGRLAAKGCPHPELLEKMLSHPFFKISPPKSTGREEFGEKFLEKIKKSLDRLSIEDALATLLELTAITVADAYKKWVPELPEKIYFSGGGALNITLLKRIQYYLPKCEVLTSEELGWPSQAIEGGAFAYLAYARIREKKLSLPMVTGAQRDSLLGVIWKI